MTDAAASPASGLTKGSAMDRRSALIHAKHSLDSAASIALVTHRDDCRFTREIVLDAMSVSTPERDFSHIIAEKCDVLATSTLPKRIARIRELIDDVRELLATS